MAYSKSISPLHNKIKASNNPNTSSHNCLRIKYSAVLMPSTLFSNRVINKITPAPNSMEKIARCVPSKKKLMTYQTFSLTVPSSFMTDKLSAAGSGNEKYGMFINKIPSNAMPLRLSRITILSLWLTGAAIAGAVALGSILSVVEVKNISGGEEYFCISRARK